MTICFTYAVYTHTYIYSIYTYTHTYIYMCVCGWVCVCNIWTDVKLPLSAFHWDWVQRSYQWNGISSLASWTYLHHTFEEIYLISLILFNCTFWDSVPDGSLQWSSSCLVCAYHLYRCKTSILWRAVWHACPDHETVGMSRHEWEGKRGRFPVPAHIHTYIYIICT